MRRGKRRVGAALALAAVVAVVLILLLSDGSSRSGGAGKTPSYSGAATVQRRNLVSTDTESGTLSYANPQTVYNRLSGTITWLPPVGRLIRPGQALFDVDNQPVLLMDGSTPAYRSLDPSDSAGPDVLELNRNLVDLGYDPDDIVIDDDWQAATTAGVERLQEAEGWTENGTLTLGQVVFLPGPQLVATVDGTVGSTGASLSDPSARDEFVSFPRDGSGDGNATTPTGTTPATTTPSTTALGTTTPATTTPTTTAPAQTTTTPTKTTPAGQGGATNAAAVARQLATLEAQLQAIKRELKHASGAGKPAGGGAKPSGSAGKPSDSGSKPSGASASPGGGSGGGSATAILQTTSTQLVVTVDLGASLQSEATLGERVGVEMPDGSTVGGRVTAVSSVAQSSGSGDQGSDDDGSGGSGSATVPVTITLDRRASGAGLDQAAVSVDFTKQSANHVLSVPVTALIATSGQSFAVQEAVPPSRLIPVTTGLFAAGYVQISGSGIHPGLKVTDSQG